MTKLLKKKYSSSIVILLVILAVVMTGLVVYTVTSTSLSQTTTQSEASGDSCNGFCTKLNPRSQANCVATCQDVKTGDQTCADLCALNRSQSMSNTLCMKGCQAITPLGNWCGNVSCNFGQVGGTGACFSICMEVNQGGQTCNQVCDARFPKVGGKQSQPNGLCRAACPSWIMPVP